MRIIWYMMDGLSAEKIYSLNKNRDIKTASYNFFDDLISKSLSISRLYGSGETFASVASKLTGESVLKLQSDDWLQSNSFQSKKNIASLFKKKYNTKNIFYRNYSSKYPTIGVYKRFNDLCTYGFDKYILADDSRIDLKDSTEVNKYNDYFELNSDSLDKNKFIFIHDLYLHDHPTAYKSTSFNDYEVAIIEASEHLNRNLEYLKFDKSSDILILSSDHGMTIQPNGQMYSKSLTTTNEYFQYRVSLYSELKVRAFISIYSENIEAKIIEEPKIMKDAYDFVLDTIDCICNDSCDNVKHKQAKEYVITSVSDLVFGNNIPLALREKFHAHLICYKGYEKWIYHRWPIEQISYVNLAENESLISIKYSELPIIMQKYIKSYYSKYNFLKKSFWIVKMIYRYIKFWK